VGSVPRSQEAEHFLDNGPNETYNSDSYKNELRETSRRPCKVVRNIGDADAVFAKGGKVREADYYVPLLAHATMEPLVALAEFKDGKATLWLRRRILSCNKTSFQRSWGSGRKMNLSCNSAPEADSAHSRDYVVSGVCQEKWPANESGLDPRGTTSSFDYYNAVASMYMKATLGTKRQTDRVAATVGLSSDSFHFCVMPFTRS